MMILYGVYTLFLVILSLEDIRSRMLPAPVLLLGAVLGIAVRAWSGWTARIFPDILAFAPGAFLLLMSGISRGGIGAGDGLVFLVTGIWLGPEKTFWMFAGGLLCTSLGALILCAGSFRNGRRSLSKRLPMVPFLLPVWMILLADGIAGGGASPGALP